MMNANRETAGVGAFWIIFMSKNHFPSTAHESQTDMNYLQSMS